MANGSWSSQWFRHPPATMLQVSRPAAGSLLAYTEPALIRLAGMLLIEQNDECLVQRRYLSDHSIQLVLSTLDGSEQARSNNNDKEVIELNAD